MAWAMLAGGVGMGDMTLRMLALAMVVVLALPAVVALLRRGPAPDDPEGPSTTTRLDALWLVVPVVLLVVLVVLSVAA